MTDVAYSLTRVDAQLRSSQLTIDHMDVTVDVRQGADREVEYFTVTSQFTMRTTAASTFIDIDGEVTAVTVDGRQIPYQHEGERLHVSSLPTDITCVMTVEARCRYSTTGEGLHRYVDPEDGRVYLYTQFEPTDAHRAWPCVDQPDLKPRWTFHVLAPASWVVASNGACEQCEVHDDGTQTVHCATTPPLSSYITALVAGDYAVVDGGMWSASKATVEACPEAATLTIPLRLMCRQALAQHMDSDDILTVTRQGLDYFHQRYRYAYPWGTYDQVFVPEYNLGAMENPGCVTFNERYLSRDTPTYAERQGRANTILHEMCHMWFGDLATPAWWDDLWLKESFADNQGTMAAAEATQYSTEWASFAIARKAWAYQQDAYPTTHPIVADIPDVNAAKTNFDGITYAKGASVLKQLVAWVGPEAFFQAAQRYFRDHAFAATGLGDLLDALGQAVGEDLGEWSAQWLHTTGPSVLRATIVHEATAAELADNEPSATPPQDSTTTTGCSSALLRITQGALGDTEDQKVTLRPHKFHVDLYTTTGSLSRIATIPVRMDNAQVDIPVDASVIGDLPAAAIDLVVVNSRDDTYAITLLDQRSTATAVDHISDITNPVTRAVVWSSLWQAVREAHLPVDTYARAVLAHATNEPEDAILQRLLTTLGGAVASYMPSSQRQDFAREIAHHAQTVLQELTTAGPSAIGETADGPQGDPTGCSADITRADRQRLWAKTLVTMLPYIDTLPASLRAILDGASTGQCPIIPDTHDLRWLALTTLAARGDITRDTLDAALESNRTGEAEVHHSRAIGALPDAHQRHTTWQTLLHDTPSNEHLSAQLEGLALSTWTGTELRDAFFDAVEDFWNTHSIGLGIRFVRAGFPHTIDADNPQATHDLITLSSTWLDTHDNAPADLRRLMIENHDDLLRAHAIHTRSCERSS